MGNPAFNKTDYLRSFLKYIENKGASLCINGDCFDLLQCSHSKLAADLKSVCQNIHDFVSSGTGNFYYIGGNHDFHSATYLAKANFCKAKPFLNVVSGNRRIHIEHGHLFDRRFREHPQLHLQVSRILGKLLRISPQFFHLFFHLEWWVYGLNKKNDRKSPLFDVPRNLSAALDLFSRGFDIVILAHSHRHGLHLMEDGKVFANAGAWTSSRIYYLEIQGGSVELREWRGGRRLSTQMAPISWWTPEKNLAAETRSLR